MFSEKSKESYEEIYTRNIRRLLNYAYAQLRSRGDAEELANEAMLVLWQKMKEQEIKNPDAYVTQILANLIRNFMRSKQRQIDTISLEAIGDTIAGEEMPERISDGFPPELTSSEKEILMLRVQRSLSFNEISQILGLPDSSCRSRFFRAKAHYKELLTKKSKAKQHFLEEKTL